jgi:hypothetical protein
MQLLQDVNGPFEWCRQDGTADPAYGAYGPTSRGLRWSVHAPDALRERPGPRRSASVQVSALQPPETSALIHR